MVINNTIQNLTSIDFNEGHILLINKPLTWTSFDVVGKIRVKICRKINQKKLKVGHGGTLDPLATGLMIVGIGKATKQMQQFQDEPKQYIAELKFGATTPSFDKETVENAIFPTQHINSQLIKECLAGSFTGAIQQTPPLFSAKKINGKRAYEHARNGDDIILEKNNITIYSAELLSYEAPNAVISIHCSKGTYIRSIANDLGKLLNSGAYLTALKRTCSGGFNLDEAIEIEDFEKLLEHI